MAGYIPPFTYRPGDARRERKDRNTLTEGKR